MPPKSSQKHDPEKPQRPPSTAATALPRSPLVDLLRGAQHMRGFPGPRVAALGILACAGLLAVFLAPRLLIGIAKSPSQACIQGSSLESRERGHVLRLAVNYADRCCNNSQPKSCASMLRHGAHTCLQYNASSLDPAFRERNMDILMKDRGAGFWLWKPYVILRTLLYEMEEGDLLLYADSGSLAKKDLGPIFDLAMDDDIVLFQTPSKWYLRERQWTKPDAFTIIGCSIDECGKNIQMLAAFSVWRRSFRSIQFASQWLTYMEDPRVSTDIPNEVNKNVTGFADHRHDQSVLGLLAHRWGINPYNYSHIKQAFTHNRDKT